MYGDTTDAMARTSRAIVENCLSVAAGEEVFVVTDPRKARIARSVASTCYGMGATPIVAEMPLLEAHGNEPPATVADGMATADVAFTCTTHAITHTRSRLRAMEAGTRIGILRGVTEDMMVEGAMTVDFEALRRTTEAVRDRLTEAEEVHVISGPGTDVTFSVEGRPGFSLDGYFREEYGFAALPPGEAPICPVEGTANGTVVVDVSMDNIGAVEEPIVMTFEDGDVTGIDGGVEAEELAAIVEANEEGARNLAEFAIGTNPKAKFIGNLAEDKKRLGTVHFAIGDNESLGGSVRSDIHLDGVVNAPTVELDGEAILVEGDLRI